MTTPLPEPDLPEAAIPLDREYLAKRWHLLEGADDKTDALVEAFFQDLQERIGLDLVDCLTNDELTAFETFVESGDSHAGRQFLEAHVPEFSERVQHETHALVRLVDGALPAIRAEILFQRVSAA